MVIDSTKALIVSATAGSGKTTTLIDGVTYAVSGKLPTKYKPSEEQLAIWSWLADHINAESEVIFLAFSKAIATELDERLTHGKASTLHALGCRVLRENKVKYKLETGKWKTINLFLEHQGIDDIRDLNNDQRAILDDVCELVKFVKDNVLTEDDITNESLQELCVDRGYEPASALDVVAPLVKHIIEVGSVISKGLLAKVRTIDFDDMIYLPARYNYKASFDVMLIDEAQDLSCGKLRLVMNQDCSTYVFVGDPNQAIFGFAGADTQSFASIAETIGHDKIEVLPLTYTYRCGKRIVSEAQQIVGAEAIKYGETNPEGSVTTIDENVMSLVEGDMLVSRVNAPLMAIAWALVKERKNVKVVGKDIGAGLVRLIKKLAGKKITKADDLIEKVEAWRIDQIMKLQKKRFDTECQQIAVNDQADCIVQIAQVENTVKGMITFIDGLFDDSDMKKCIRLSSIHRAKGLESSRVFFYNPGNVPHPMAKTNEAKLQERNLKFVAVTRAINELVYVTPKKKKLAI